MKELMKKILVAIIGVFIISLKVNAELGEISINGTENYEYAKEVLSIVNEKRAEVNLEPLVMDQTLTEKAMQRAYEISVYYSHNRASGESVFTIFNDISYTAAGENIAVNYTNPTSVMTGWMNSKDHKANLLAETDISKLYTTIGIGCVTVNNNTYWVQLFSTNTPISPNLNGVVANTKTITINDELISPIFSDAIKEENILNKGETLSILKDNKAAIINAGYPSNITPFNIESIMFTSADNSIATVNDLGVITAVAEGKTTINVSIGKIVYSYKVVVNKNEEKKAFSFTEEEIEIEVRETKNTTIIDESNNDEKITYNSENNGIVSIDEEGNVTGVKEGNTEVTATTSNNQKAILKVTVKPKKEQTILNEFEISDATIDLKPNEKPIFSGVVKSEMYTIDETWKLTTQTESGTYEIDELNSISTNDDFNNYVKENGTIIEKIEEGKLYTYSVTIKIKKDYANMLDNNLENNYVIINGTKYNFTTGGSITSEDGSIEISFENILTKKVPIIINEENISLSKTTYIYTGNEIRPKVIVEKQNNILELDNDYKVTYENNINVGKATITIEGVNDYTNTIVKEFTIEKKNIVFNINKVASETYDGKNHTPKVIVKDNEKELIINKDYKVSYKNNINAGTATIIIEGIGNYEGNKTINFIINKKESSIPEETKISKSILTGSKLSDITLKTNGLKWINGKITIKKGYNKYQAQYLQNNDNTNYTPVYIDITVKGLSIIKINTNAETGHGEIISSHKEAVEGQLISFNFIPEEGYRTKGVKINDTQIIINENKYSVIASDVDMNISVIFSPIEHQIEINGTEYIDMDIPSISSVIHNGSKEIMLTPKKGYKIVSIRVNDIERINDLTDNILKLNNIISDTKINIATEILVYRFIDGATQTYHSGEKTPLTFRINASHKKFEKLYLDNKLVDNSKYSITEGSTIITFAQDYVSKLAYGTHSLKAVFTDGGDAKTTFVLSPKEIENPNTVDRIISYIVVLMICLAIVIVVVYKKNNED